MVASKPPGTSELYLDFAQFNKLRTMTRTDESQALRATARQMEGVFLNMMLQSMRQANAMFTEDGLFQSRETEFYQGMFDKQLTTNIANNSGIGLADVIVKQLESMKPSASLPDLQSYPTESYLSTAIPALYTREHKVETDTRFQSDSDLQASDVEPDLQPLKWTNPKEFVEVIYPFAEKAAAKLGVSVNAVIAQAVLETGWGKKILEKSDGVTSHNLFGIKADSQWKGSETRNTTTEYRNGIAAKEEAAFRSYSTVEDAFEDYVAFLENNPRYKSVVRNNIESKQWGYLLQKAGYATDPNYGNKIAQIMESDILQSVVSRDRPNG